MRLLGANPCIERGSKQPQQQSEEQEEEGDTLVECTYCNFAWHPACAKNLTAREQKTGQVSGAWACPECVTHAAQELGLDEQLAEAAAAADEEDDLVLDQLEDGHQLVFGEWSTPHLQLLLSDQADFKGQKSRLEEVVEERGHIAFFLPKFHCELNYIELYWAQVKHKTRGRADFTWKGLKQSMWQHFGEPDSLDDETTPYTALLDPDPPRLNSHFLQRASRKARHFFSLYLEHPGKSGMQVRELRQAMKPKKSHRRPAEAGVVEPVSAPQVTRWAVSRAALISLLSRAFSCCPFNRRAQLGRSAAPAGASGASGASRGAGGGRGTRRVSARGSSR